MIGLPNGESNEDVVKRMRRSKFGLGDRRTLDQLIQFTGFDLRNERVSIDGKNRCGNIQWVPFVEHPKGVNFIPSFDNETEDPLDVPYETTSVWYDPNIDGKGMVQKHGKDEKTEAELDKLPIDGNLDKRHAALSDTVRAAEKEAEQENLDEHHPNQDLGKMHEALANKIHALRGAGKKMKEKVKAVKGFLHEHPLVSNKQVHGFQELPLFVRCNVFILVFGTIFFIYKSKGTGRAFRRNDRKREL